MKREEIPDIVVRRLPIYARTLRLMREAGITSVSSGDFGARIGVSAAQIRRDLSYFGHFGRQGKGYNVAALEEAIARILKIDRQWDVALAGFGNLGQAIANYRGFALNGFRIAAIFAKSDEQIGQEVDGVVVRPETEIMSMIRDSGIKIGIIAVPASAAQEVADQMIAAGVRAILNYAPVVLKIPGNVWVREIDPTSALQSLTFYLEPCQPHTNGIDPDGSIGSAGPAGPIGLHRTKTSRED